jgi:hypothetical protein
LDERKRPLTSLQPNNNSIVDEDHLMTMEEGEDEDEVEALIRKRVKQGTGREYESIVQK